MIYNNLEYKTPLSPKLLDSAKFGQHEPLHDKVKSDIFSLGITILCASLNTNFERYYDWKNFKINTLYPPTHIKSTIRLDSDLFEKDFYLMSDLGYSEELIDTISWMLTMDEESRPYIDNLIAYLEERNETNPHVSKAWENTVRTPERKYRNFDDRISRESSPARYSPH